MTSGEPSDIQLLIVEVERYDDLLAINTPMTRSEFVRDLERRRNMPGIHNSEDFVRECYVRTLVYYHELQGARNRYAQQLHDALVARGMQIVDELLALSPEELHERAQQDENSCPNCGCQPGERATDTYEDGAVAICLCDCHFPPAPVPRRSRLGEVETA